LYGFGLVDAEAAVSVAREWESYDRERFVTRASGIIDLPIDDEQEEAAISTILIGAQEDLIVENVVVYLDVQAFSRGHLEVILTSPSGTQSVLLPGSRPENTQLDDEKIWKLRTVRHWGETASGQWTLSVQDVKDGDVAECIDLPLSVEVENFDFDWGCYQYENSGLCGNATFPDDDVFTASNTPTTSPSDMPSTSPTSTPGRRLDEFESGLTALEDESGLTALDACCACGGGIDTNAFEDIFQKWRVVIFGHEEGSKSSKKGGKKGKKGGKNGKKAGKKGKVQKKKAKKVGKRPKMGKRRGRPEN
jgi:subtilisin-like proprotein convertase family protein